VPIKQIEQYNVDINRYTKQINSEGLSPVHLFDITAMSKPHAIAALSNSTALNITHNGVPLGHHIPYCWESIGVFIVNNPNNNIIEIESDNGDTTIHIIIKNSSRARRAVLECKNKELLKKINKKSGASVLHLLTYDDLSASFVINSNMHKKELLRCDNNGATVAHWIARHSLKGTITLLNKLEYALDLDKNFFEYVLRQKDNNGDTVNDTIKRRWANNLAIHDLIRP
jgi:hypothetical protein